MTEKEIENLQNELKLHKKINHPNIISFIDYLSVGHYLYILLEHAANGCLFFYIHSISGLIEAVALRIMWQVAEATQYLHQNKIIHRDLKPENILFDENFNVKICDFGWSSFIDAEDTRQTVCGTFEYMAPEMLTLGKVSYDHKLDVWCMGILLYEILHGNPPFSGTSLEDIRNQHSLNPIQIKCNLSTETKMLIKGMTDKDTASRFEIKTVLQILEHLRNENRFNKVINEVEYREFIQNYIINIDSVKNRDLPDEFLNIRNKKELNSFELPLRIKEKVCRLCDVKSIQNKFLLESSFKKVQSLYSKIATRRDNSKNSNLGENKDIWKTDIKSKSTSLGIFSFYKGKDRSIKNESKDRSRISNLPGTITLSNVISSSFDPKKKESSIFQKQKLANFKKYVTNDSTQLPMNSSDIHHFPTGSRSPEIDKAQNKPDNKTNRESFEQSPVEKQKETKNEIKVNSTKTNHYLKLFDGWKKNIYSNQRCSEISKKPICSLYVKSDIHIPVKSAITKNKKFLNFVDPSNNCVMKGNPKIENQTNIQISGKTKEVNELLIKNEGSSLGNNSKFDFKKLKIEQKPLIKNWHPSKNFPYSQKASQILNARPKNQTESIEKRPEIEKLTISVRDVDFYLKRNRIATINNLASERLINMKQYETEKSKI